jgi:hypothetical protein
MVAAATRKLAPFGERACARVGDVTSLPFPDRSFDPWLAPSPGGSPAPGASHDGDGVDLDEDAGA